MIHLRSIHVLSDIPFSYADVDKHLFQHVHIDIEVEQCIDFLIHFHFFVDSDLWQNRDSIILYQMQLLHWYQIMQRCIDTNRVFNVFASILRYKHYLIVLA